MLTEYLFRYRMLRPWARLLIICVLGVLPGAWNYLDAASGVEQQLEISTGDEAAARLKLSKMKAQLKEMPALEAKQIAIRDQLEKAKEKLPNEIHVDEVLHTVSHYANQCDVRIRKFEPTGVKLVQGDYPYSEARFKVSMSGKYGNLGEWLDSVGGVQSKAYVKSWRIERFTVPRTVSLLDKIAENAAAKKEQEKRKLRPGESEAIDESLLLKQNAEEARRSLLLSIEAELVMYSSPSKEQLAALAASLEAEKKKGGNTAESTQPTPPSPEAGKQATPATPQGSGGAH